MSKIARDPSSWSESRFPAGGAFRACSSTYLLALACAGLLTALHSTHLLDSDEGLILNGAWSILNGRKLYTDFFEFVAPGSFYLIAGSWSLLGAHYWVAKVISIIAIAASAAGVYRISQVVLDETRFTAPRWAMFFSPLVLCLYSGYWPAINHNTFSIAMVIWSTYFVTQSILRKDVTSAATAGFLCGIAILFLQHRGALLGAVAVSGLLFFQDSDKAESKWKRPAAFLMASSLPVGSMFLIWPASLLFKNLINFPATHYLEVNRLDLSLFAIVATFVVLAAWLLRHSTSRAVWFLMSLQVGLFVSSLQRPDESHITPILFPLLALFPILLSTAWKTSQNSKRFLVWIAAGLLMISAQVPVLALHSYSTPLFEVSQHSALRYVRENCGGSPFVYAGPFVPGIYFETGKLNATRYSVLLTKFSTDAQFLDAVSGLDFHRPQCVVTNYSTADKFNYSKNNVVDEYIVRNYEVVYEVGRTQVWSARRQPGGSP